MIFLRPALELICLKREEVIELPFGVVVDEECLGEEALMTGFVEQSGHHPDDYGEIKEDIPVPIGGRGHRNGINCDKVETFCSH